MIRPVEFSFITRAKLGDSYEHVCAAAGLSATDGGWGLLHCVNDDGERVTAVTDDVSFLEALVENNGSAALSELEIPAGKFPGVRQGWPDDWAGTVNP